MGDELILEIRFFKICLGMLGCYVKTLNLKCSVFIMVLLGWGGSRLEIHNSQASDKIFTDYIYFPLGIKKWRRALK